MKLEKYINEAKAKLTGDQLKDKYLKQLNSWDSDLSKMTKAYKSLKTGITGKYGENVFHDSDQKWKLIKDWEKHPIMKDFVRLRKAFSVFRANFDKWLFTDILNQEGNNRRKEETYYQTEIRATGWQFSTSLNSLFPHEYDNVVNKDIDAPWLLDRGTYGDKNYSRKVNISRYQRKWRDFKKIFTEFIEYEAEKITQAVPDETINVGGVNIVVQNRVESEYGKKYVKQFISHTRKATQALKKVGLEKAIKDFTVILNFKKGTVDPRYNNSLTAGAYRKEDDSMWIFPLGMDRKVDDSTLVHEIGHRYWFKHVPERAKKEWEDGIFAKNVRITKEHIDLFFKRFYQENRWSGDDLGGWMDRKDMKKAIEKEDDPELKAVFKTLNDHKPMWWKDEETKNNPNYSQRQDYYDNTIKWHKGTEAPIEWITDYGRTNPAEAFAEVFKIWVGGLKRKLGEWTRAFFKRVVSAGGANIKEEIKMNILEKIDKYIKEGASASDIENYIMDEFSGKSMSNKELFNRCAGEIGAKKYEFQVAVRNLMDDGEITKMGNKYKIG